MSLTDGDFEALYGHAPTRKAIEKAVAMARQPIPLPPLDPPVMTGLQGARPVSPLQLLFQAFRPSPEPPPPEPPVSAGAIPEPHPNAAPPPSQPVFRQVAPVQPSAALPRAPTSELQIAVAFGAYVVRQGEEVMLAPNKVELRRCINQWIDQL